MAGTPSTPTQNFIGVEISTSTTDNPANYNVAPDNLLLDEAKLSAGTMPLDVRKSSTCIIYQQPSPHYNVEHCCSILLDVAKRSAGETPCRWTFLRVRGN